MASANINSVINLALPSSSPDNFQDPQVKAAVDLFLISMNNFLREFEKYVGVTQKDMALWSSLLPSDTLLSHQMRRLYVTAGANLILSDLIQLYNDAGTLKARKAQATAGTVRAADGFCSTADGILTGQRGEVILSSGIATITGVNPGDRLYLSTAAGQATLVAPAGVGQLEQFVGIGVSVNVAFINIANGPYIQH